MSSTEQTESRPAIDEAHPEHRSQAPATARALSVLTRDLRTVLGELRTGTVVPGTAMQALNRDAARTDAACGTLHV